MDSAGILVLLTRLLDCWGEATFVHPGGVTEAQRLHLDPRLRTKTRTSAFLISGCMWK